MSDIARSTENFKQVLLGHLLGLTATVTLTDHHGHATTEEAAALRKKAQLGVLVAFLAYLAHYPFQAAVAAAYYGLYQGESASFWNPLLAFVYALGCGIFGYIVAGFPIGTLFFLGGDHPKIKALGGKLQAFLVGYWLCPVLMMTVPFWTSWSAFAYFLVGATGLMLWLILGVDLNKPFWKMVALALMLVSISMVFTEALGLNKVAVKFAKVTTNRWAPTADTELAKVNTRRHYITSRRTARQECYNPVTYRKGADGNPADVAGKRIKAPADFLWLYNDDKIIFGCNGLIQAGANKMLLELEPNWPLVAVVREQPQMLTIGQSEWIATYAAYDGNPDKGYDESTVTLVPYEAVKDVRDGDPMGTHGTYRGLDSKPQQGWFAWTAIFSMTVPEIWQAKGTIPIYVWALVIFTLMGLNALRKKVFGAKTASAGHDDHAHH